MKNVLLDTPKPKATPLDPDEMASEEPTCVTSTPPKQPKTSVEPQTASPSSLKGRLAVKTSKIKQHFAKATTGTRSSTGSKCNAAAGLSIFSRLPLELRDAIWDLVLSPKALNQKADPAHFHVCGKTVYDACTYELKRKRDRNPRWKQIPLLLTSHATTIRALRSRFVLGSHAPNPS